MDANANGQGFVAELDGSFDQALLDLHQLGHSQRRIIEAQHKGIADSFQFCWGCYRSDEFIVFAYNRSISRVAECQVLGGGIDNVGKGECKRVRQPVLRFDRITGDWFWAKS
jgi:hypothetical protein